MKNILTTGASSGIGLALAREFAGRGHNLALVARRLDILEGLRSEILAAFPDRQVEIEALDVTDYDRVPTVVEDLAARLGSLDIVVAGAGIGSTAPIGTGHAAGDRAVIATNVLGAMATIDAAAIVFRRQQQGQVVVISSVAGYRGLPGAASYSASKASIAVYAEALRAELHGTGIKVTTLFPGFIDTPLNQDVERRPFLITLDKGVKEIADKIERGRKRSTIPARPWALIAPTLRVLPTSVVAKMG